VANAAESRMGEKLIEMGAITADHLKLALRKQKIDRILLGKTLIDLNFVDEETISSLLATKSTANYLDIHTVDFDTDAIALIPMSMAAQYTMIPFKADDRTISIIIDNPTNVRAIDAVWASTRRRAEVFTSSKRAIQEAIESLYHEQESLDAIVDEIMSMDLENMDDADESPIVRLVNHVITYAVKSKATDVHIEPEGKILRIRMRVDGVMRVLVLLPSNALPYLISRIKVEAGLDLTEKRVPQDGRFSKQIMSRNIEIRVSTLRSIYGERVVMRLLDKDDISADMGALGVDPEMQDIIEEQIHKPNGMLLVSGPTGSGKTTTLYSMLLKLDRNKETIMTAEDPVEYQVDGLQQIPVDEDAGLTFSEILRSILRQDPDKIMVGEIRDYDTAEIASRAAITGHLVLSSVHTNSAIETVYRLIDLGIEPFIINSALNGVIGQRLIRRLCQECSTPMSQEDRDTVIDKYNLNKDSEWNFREPIGCKACHNSGYSGRIGVYEFWENKPEYHTPLAKKVSIAELEAIAEKLGFKSMFTNGLKKAAEGLTSISEVLRVTKHA